MAEWIEHLTPFQSNTCEAMPALPQTMLFMLLVIGCPSSPSDCFTCFFLGRPVLVRFFSASDCARSTERKALHLATSRDCYGWRSWICACRLDAPCADVVFSCFSHMILTKFRGHDPCSACCKNPHVCVLRSPSKHSHRPLNEMRHTCKPLSCGLGRLAVAVCLSLWPLESANSHL